jgi:hypothetical protein
MPLRGDRYAVIARSIISRAMVCGVADARRSVRIGNMKRARGWISTGVAMLSLILGILVLPVARRAKVQTDQFTFTQTSRTGRAGTATFSLGTAPTGIEFVVARNLPPTFIELPVSRIIGGGLRYESFIWNHVYTVASSDTERSTETFVWSPSPHRRLGFGYDFWSLPCGPPPGATCAGTTLDIPFWAIALLFAIVPFKRIWKTVRGRYRTKDGLCVNCGYDLRASPERCPECGNVSGKPV